MAFGVLMVDGKVLPPAEARPILDQLIATAFSGIIDDDICATYAPTDGQLISKAVLNGKPFGVDAVVQWVGDGDGYTVAP